MQIQADELYRRIDAGRPPLVLDVRNGVEFGRWPIEGPVPVPMCNVPYFDFIEDEAGAVAKVAAWTAGRADDLVVVCAKGDSSDFVAEVLRQHGIAAQNLAGGMLAWGSTTVCRLLCSDGPLRVWQVQRFGTGCLSYVVAAGRDAVVVDPHRRAGDYLAFVERQGLVLRGVLDTHLHADHVSGGPELARRGGTDYHGHPADFAGAAFRFAPLGDRTALRLGELEVVPVTAVHAPGHTPGSTMFLVHERLLLSGDTLFVQGLGRPDLGGQTERWGRDLFRTLTQRIVKVADGTEVLPAHTSGPAERRPDGVVGCRLGALRAGSPLLALDENAFVQAIAAQVKAPPAQYARIRRINLGSEAVTEDDTAAMELGKNECAMREMKR